MLGDRLLEVILYEDSLKESMTDPGKLSHFRDKLVSNKNMAIHAEKLFVPWVLPKPTFDSLSIRERATLLEAYIGGLYMDGNYKVSADCKRAIKCIIENLKASVPSENVKSENRATFTDLLSGYGALLSDVLTTYDVSGDWRQPCFRCVFDPKTSDKLKDTPLKGIGRVEGPMKFTVRAAENKTCGLVLQQLASLEEYGRDEDVSLSSSVLSARSRLLKIHNETMRRNIATYRIFKTNNISNDSTQPIFQSIYDATGIDELKNSVFSQIGRVLGPPEISIRSAENSVSEIVLSLLHNRQDSEVISTRRRVRTAIKVEVLDNLKL
jgi:hypothetical protein